MNPNISFYNSESVSAGHPDKICDQISDAIVDMYLAQNPFAHLNIQTLVTTDRVVIAGEVKGAQIDPKAIEDIIRHTVKTIGYDQPGFSYQTLTIDNYLHEQSADIAHAVGEAHNGDYGAGDQGFMFGYACTETETFMPTPIYYAHKLMRNLHHAKLGPDGKCQVTMRYEDNHPVAIEAIVLSTQHHVDLSRSDVEDIVIPIIESSVPNKVSRIIINPAGRFVIGGPEGDTGLTGRKSIVDTYGGAVPHGGGAFSGKDPTKVDRSAAYMMRYLAKNIVAAGLCERCTLQISYAIGENAPVSFSLHTHNSSRVPNELIYNTIQKSFDLSPHGIRVFLKLNKPIYLKTATYGHFGREPEDNGGFSWEKLDSVPLFKALL